MTPVGLPPMIMGTKWASQSGQGQVRHMTQWTPIQGLKSYSRILGRKMLFVFIAWFFVYWISQPFRTAGDLNVLMLFAPMIGAFAGLVVGWYMATDSVEDSGMFGLGLWTILIIAGCIPIWAMEGLMHLLMPGRPFGFGGWMLVMAAMLLTLAASVWHASSQE
jgi:hypothetical protein